MASGLFIGGLAMNPGNRSGYFAHSSAIASEPTFDSSSASAGPATASIGGEASDRIWR